MPNIQNQASELLELCAKNLFAQITSADISPQEAKDVINDLEALLKEVSEDNFLAVIQKIRTKYPSLNSTTSNYLLYLQELQNKIKAQEIETQLKRNAG